MNRTKPLTREQYLKKFSWAARWRLLPPESEEAIADYRELVFREGRDELKLAEELGRPTQAARLLTDGKAYRRWLAVFAVLVFGLFLLVKWVWNGRSVTTRLLSVSCVWYPVLVMAVGVSLSLCWFRRHGQKSGKLSARLLPATAAVLVFGIGITIWTLAVADPAFLGSAVGESWQIMLHRELLIDGEIACALAALLGLVLAKCRDRRWLALYVPALTVAAMCGFLLFTFSYSNTDYAAPGSVQAYLFARLVPVGVAGLVGTGVALC